jgi:hypothetical protein
MANETTEILRLVLDADQAIKKTADLKNQRDALIDTNKELTASEGKNSEAVLKNDAAIKILNQEIAKQTKETNNLVKAQLAAEGSNDQLKAQLSVLTAQYNALSKAERTTSDVGKAFADQINVITQELSGTEQGIGNFKRGIGDYEGSVIRAGKSLSDLKARLSDLQKTIQNTDIDTKEFRDAKDEAANLGLQIGQLEGKLDEFGNKEPKNPAKKAFEDTLSSAAALGSGIELVSLAFGESEDVQASVAKSLKAIAIGQQLANIAKEAGAIIDTIALAKSSALAAANFVLSGSTTLLTTITTAFGTASAIAWSIATLGAAALVAGIVLLVANFDKVLNAVTDFVGLTSEQDRATNELNKSYEAQIVVLDGIIEREKSRGEIVQRQFDRQIKLAKSLGLDTLAIEKSKEEAYQKTLLAQNAAAQKEADIIKKSNKGTAKQYGELLKTIQENNIAIQQSRDNIAIAQNEANQKIIEDEKKKNEKLTAAQKTANDKLKEEQKKYQEDIKSLNDEFLLTDRQRLEKSFTDKLAIIKGNGEEEVKLRTAISKAQRESLLVFDAESAAAELERKQKKRDDVLAIESGLINDQIALNDTLLQNELSAVDNSVDSERNKIRKKAEINLKYLQTQLDLAQKLADVDGVLTEQEIANIEKVKQAIIGAQNAVTQAQQENPPKTLGQLFGATPEEGEKIDAAIEFTKESLANISSLVNERFQREIDGINQVADAEIEAVDQSTLSEEEKEKRKNEINRKAAKQAYAIQLKQFNADKALNLITAVINGAQAVLKAAAQLGPIGAGIAAGISIASIGLIAQQQPPPPPSFAGGVVGMMGAGNGTSDSIPAYLSRGESVITERGTNLSEQINPGYLAWLNRPNKFATGLDPIQSSFIPPQSVNVGEQIREALAGLTIVTKVTDIDKAQIDRRQVREVSVI